MTKRVTILALALLGRAIDETSNQPAVAYPGSTLDLDDTTAGLLVVAGKARYDKDAKLKDTTKAHEAELEARAKAVATPESSMAQLVASAVASTIASLGLVPKADPAAKATIPAA
jgi:hypothetical protein